MLEKEDSVHLIAFWEKEKFIAREGAFLKLYGFETAVDAQKNLLTDLLEKNYLNYGFSPPPAETGKSGVKEALYALLKENKLISLDSSYFIHREYYHKARTVFNDLYMKTGAVLLGDYRDALKSSRKIALLLLESLERKGFAKKQNIDGILTRIPREISEKPPRL
jgi:selenocysteine-specific elongation factor